MASSKERSFPSTVFCRWLLEEPGAALTMSVPFPTQAAVSSASRIVAVVSSSCDASRLSAPEGAWVWVVVGCPEPSSIFEASNSSMKNSELSSSGAGRITVAYVRMQSSCS